MKRLSLKQLSVAGLIAALYAVVSLVFLPYSFGIYQVRVAEALTVLPFLTAAAIPGLFVGCLLANIFGGMGWLDIVFGPLLTLLAALGTRYVYQLSQYRYRQALALLPLLTLWVGALYLLSNERINFYILGCSLVSVAGLILALWLEYRKHKPILNVTVIKLASLLIILLVIYLSHTNQNEDEIIYLLGALAIICAWLFSLIMISYWFLGKNSNILLAPLPPVIINAFGVSLYLAPLFQMNYWFSVQMIGVGELIACYLLGLPLLLFIDKRKSIFNY
ncbi:MAG: QueT transporter family protein [Candidatus Zixiibacteriota bacterium]